MEQGKLKQFHKKKKVKAEKKKEKGDGTQEKYSTTEKRKHIAVKMFRNQNCNCRSAVKKYQKIHGRKHLPPFGI